MKNQIKTLNDEEKVHALKKKSTKQRNVRHEDNPRKSVTKKSHDANFNCVKCDLNTKSEIVRHLGKCVISARSQIISKNFAYQN